MMKELTNINFSPVILSEVEISKLNNIRIN